MGKTDKNSIILAILPIVGIYSIAGVNIGNIILILLVAYGLYRTIKTNGRIKLKKIDKILLLFFMYTICNSLVNLGGARSINWGDMITKYIHILCFILIITVFRNKIFSTELYADSFINIALISSCFLIIQFFLYKVAGISLYGVLEPYRTNITNDISRPCSFFVEPAHFCRYCTLPLFLILFKDLSKNNIIKAVVITIAVVISQSSIGYISTAAIWGAWLIRNVKNGRIKKSSIFKNCGLITLAVTIGLVLSTKYGLFDFVSNHVSGLNMREITSGNVRVFRGFFVWAQEGLFEKMFGVGFANVKNYMIKNSIITIFDGQMELGNEYMSSISYILVMNGIIGLMIFLFALIHLYKKSDSNRVLVFLFVLLMVSNEEFMTIDFMNIWLYLILTANFQKKFKLKLKN